VLDNFKSGMSMVSDVQMQMCRNLTSVPDAT